MIWAANALMVVFWLASGVGGMGLTTTGGTWWPLFLAAALLAALFAFREWEARLSRPAAIALAATLPGVFLLPFPYGVPLALSGAAGLFALLSERKFSAGLLAASVMLGIQAAAIALIPLASSRVHDIPALATLLWLPTTAGGADAMIEPGRIHLHTSGVVHAFLPTAEILGLWPLIPFTATGLLQVRGRAIAVFLGATAAFVLIRFAVLALLYLDSPTVAWFTSPTGFAVSLGLLSIFLARYLPQGVGARTLEVVSISPKLSAASMALAVLLGLTATWAATYRDPGERKAGRIMINEHKSNWAWTGDKLDTEKYGEMTVYNYYCLVQHLQRHYPSVERNREPLTPARLASVDVLILKIPTAPYAPEEVDAVLDFVRNGGGVWLIGDHTDVFGSNPYLNQIAVPLGMKFQPDSVAALPRGQRQPYTPPRVLAHPLVDSIPTFQFATSDSLACGAGAWPAIIGDDSFGDEIDYGIENFVSDLMPSAHEPFGSFVQCAATTCGGGRAVAFTDSTLFSNFFIFTPGISEHALRTVEWLNRRPSGSMGLALWPVAGMALLGLIALGVVRDGAIPLVCGIALGFAAGVTASDATSRMPLPPPRERFTTIAFDHEEPRYSLEVAEENARRESYHTFFVWMQRLNLVPRQYEKLDECLSSDVIVEIEPRKRWSAARIDRVRRAVEGGATLLVMDSVFNGRSTGRDLLAPFGMSFEPGPPSDGFVPGRPTDAFSGIEIPRALAVTGGEPALIGAKSGRSVLSVKNVGRGRVVVFGAARLFGMGIMGDTSVNPDEYQSQVFRLQFWMFRTLITPEPRSR